MSRAGSVTYLLLGQGGYFLVTALWPLVSMRTFERVTGPKVDYWLVKTVAVLIGVIGGVLLIAGVRRAASLEVALLGAGSAAGLAGIDLVYAGKRRIARIYVLDAVLELVLVVLWGWFWPASR